MSTGAGPTRVGAADLSPARAALLRQLVRGEEPAPARTIPRLPGDGPWPLSFAQESVRFIGRLAGDVPLFNLVAADWIPAGVPLAEIERRLSAIAARHDALRASLVPDRDPPLMAVASSVPLRLPELVLPDDGTDPVAAAHSAALDIASRPYRLDRAPLWRAEVVHTADGRRLLVVGGHHLVMDAASLTLLAGELAGVLPEVELPVRYVDYAGWQRSQAASGAFEPDLVYWRRQLAGLPGPLDLPTDRPRPAVRSMHGATIQADVPTDVVDRIHAVSRAEGATLYMAMLATFIVLLYRYTGQPDVLVGSTVSGRNRPELRSLIGMLVNMVAIRVPLHGDPTFRAVLAQVRQTVADALARQSVPFDLLVQELRLPAARHRPPLVQVGFNMPMQENNAMLSPLPLPITSRGSQLDLTLHVVPSGTGGLRVELEYASALFDPATVRRMIDHYLALLRVLTADPSVPVRRAPMVAAAPSDEAPVAPAAAEPAPADAPLLPELLVRQARQTPEATAVVDGDITLSYAELHRRAGILAGRLRGLGVGPEVLVGVYLRRGWPAIVALLAVWRAGGCYLPLDPDQPAARTREILADAGARIVLTDGPPVEDSLGDARVVPVRECDGAAAEPPVVEVPAATGQAAYAIYTSGSTGRPKGVVITHDGIANRVCWPVRRLGIGPADRVLQKTSLTFDAAGWEIFTPLITGGAVVVAPPGAERDPRALVRAVAEHAVTVLQVVPSVLRRLVEAPGWSECAALRLLFSAGAPLPAELCARLTGLVDVAVINTYGPTECSIDVTAHEWVADQREGPVPIGRAIDNVRLCVLDRDGNPVPPGVVGELYAGGVCVGRGYLGRPELTAERFVPDPSGPPGSRAYRTGDRVRLRTDGTLEFVGRLDDQVKINGVRVEPAEVERALAGHPAVRESAVLARDSGDGTRRLVAYLVTAAEVSTAELRRHLSAGLPEQYLPAAFVRVPALPTGTSGKLDRRALAGMDGVPTPSGPRYLAPRTPLEEAVATAWAELLDLDRVGVLDDFFAVGGHSLQVGLLADRLRARLGVDLPLSALYAASTVEAQARLLVEAHPADPIPPVDRAGALPLSSGQRRMWFLERLRPGSPEHVVPVLVAVPSGAGAAEVRSALAEAVRRHEILRTRYPRTDGEPGQVIDPPYAPPLPFLDLSGDADPRAALAAVVVDLARQPFDLATGPVLRGRLVRLATQHQLLVLALHHIAWDGGSLPVLAAELDRALTVIAGRSLPADPPAIQYADYAVWQRGRSGAELAGQLDYWRSALAGARALELPADHPRPAVWSGRGRTLTFRIRPELAATARALGRRYCATPFITLLAAFNVLLSRSAGTADVVVGTPVAGRPRPELRDLIGFFVNTLVLRTDLSGRPSFAEVLERTRQTAVAAYRHQDVPFDELVDDLRPRRDLGRKPLFQIMFEVAGERLPFLPDAPGEEDPHIPWQTAVYDLTVSLVERPDGGYFGLAEYATDLFEQSTVERLMTGYLDVLSGVTAEPDGPAVPAAPDGPDVRGVPAVADGPAVSDAPTAVPAGPIVPDEPTAVPAGPAVPDARGVPAGPDVRGVPDSAGTGAPAPGGPGTLIEAFLAQAAMSPAAIAVRQGEVSLRYAELDARSAALAGRLRPLLHRPELPVALLLPRGPELVVALLAVLRAGGVCLPMDPAAPPRRLATLLADAGAGAVLTRADLRERLPAADLPVVLVDGPPPEPASAEPPGADPASGGPGSPDPGSAEPAGDRPGSGGQGGPEPVAVGPDRAAYLVHTSGSTGQPKAVLVEHGHFLAHCRAVLADYRITAADRVLMSCPPFVDVALEQIGVSLLAGATLVLADERPWSPAELPDRIAEYGITVLDVPPLAFRDMLDRVGPADARLASLALVNVGTDVVFYRDAQRWFELDLPGRFLASYGPTEAIVTSTLYPVGVDEAGRAPAHAVLPIGVAVGGTPLYVLDADLVPVPDDVVGELFLGGPGLARGYHGQPALTADRFVPDPFAGLPGARMYRTGDLVSRRPDGVLDFHGRRDRQVKINSFRVELVEIEAVLALHPRLSRACVVALGAGGQSRLAAYVVPAGGAAPDPRELAGYLRDRLPAVMVPAYWTVLAALPTTPNGKVDLGALPEPERAAPRGVPAGRPGTPVENRVAAIWREALGIDDVDPADDFFELGGNSLLATRVHTRIQDLFGVSLPLRVMFEATTVAGLAAAVAEAVEQDVATLADDEVAELLAAEPDPAGGEPSGPVRTLVRRSPEFDVTLQIKRPDFAAADRNVHHGWLLERTLDEFADGVRHLDETSRTFVPGAPRPAIAVDWSTGPAQYSTEALVIHGQQVMQDWERPLMTVLAGHVADGGGDVLEVGFGMGISASYIQQRGVRSHTIIEANLEVATSFARWRSGYPERRIQLLSGRWQDVVDVLGQFDAILFDTYPTTEAEYRAEVLHRSTFAESFFPVAAAHLRPGGVFSYYTNEVDSLGRTHQRRLLEHFRSFSVEVVTGLQPPADCEYWWANSMVAVRAVR